MNSLSLGGHEVSSTTGRGHACILGMVKLGEMDKTTIRTTEVNAQNLGVFQEVDRSQKEIQRA